MKKTEINRVFLYHDNSITQKLKKEYSQLLPAVNQLKKQSENLIGRELTPKEAENLFMDKQAFVESIKRIVSANFKFPDSPLKFNLDAIGLSFDGIDHAASFVPEQNQFIYEVDEAGHYQLLDSEFERINNAGNIYTTNENQNRVVRELETIIQSLKNLKEAGLFFDRSGILQGSQGFLKLAENEGLQINGIRVQSLQC